MAHAVKYRVSYYRKNGGQTTIDILQRNYTTPVYDIQGGFSPFESSWEGNPANLYEKPTIGSGAVLNIVTTPLSMLGLFTGDPQEWMVKVYDGASGTTLRWQGFVNAEIYTEGYSNPIASEMSVQCNDGMAVLDTIMYKDTSSFYSGKQTIGQVITNILSKLEMSFTTAYLSNDLKVTASHTNLFLYLDIFNENFIDESENPMTCRQVLDSIMGGLGLVMYFEGSSIYVVDPINLHDTSKGKSYAVAGWGSESSYSLGGYLDLSAKQITWGATGSALDMVPKVNEGYVKYNPYNFAEKSYNFGDITNWNYAGSFTSMGGYQLNTTLDYKGWTVDSGSLMQVGTRDSDYTEPEYGLRFADTAHELSYTHYSMQVSQDNRLRLKVSMQVYIQTKSDDLNFFDNGTLYDINLLKIPIAIRVGAQYWKGGINWDSGATGKWQPMLVYGSDFYPDYATATINDKWVTAEITAPIFPTFEGTLLQGQVQVEFYDNFITGNTTTYLTDQILPLPTTATDCLWSTDSAEVDCTWNGTSITIVVNNSQNFTVTVTGFKAWAGIPAHHRLNNGALQSLITNLGSGTLVSGVYHDVSNNPTVFSSTVAQTTFSNVGYTASTDTATFQVTTSGTYFGGDYDHIDSCNIYDLEFNYKYFAILFLIKDFKVEVVSTNSLQQVTNEIIESKALLSTNLTGKGPSVINTTCGSGEYGSARGALKSSVISPAGGNITGLYRISESVYRSCAYRTLESFMSQYKQPRFTLTGRLNVYGQPLNVRTKLIKDVTNQGSRAFWMVSGAYKDREEMLDVTLVEVPDTRESIT